MVANACRPSTWVIRSSSPHSHTVRSCLKKKERREGGREGRKDGVSWGGRKKRKRRQKGKGKCISIPQMRKLHSKERVHNIGRKCRLGPCLHVPTSEETNPTKRHIGSNVSPSCALYIVTLVPHTGCTHEPLFRTTHAQVRLSGCCPGGGNILNF